jgi:hypothetical protein
MAQSIINIIVRQVRHRFILLLVCALGFTCSIYGQKTRFGQVPEKPNPADYFINVHVGATHIRYYCPIDKVGYSECHRLFADVIVNRKKMELSGATTIGKHEFVLLAPGDYKARLTKNVNDVDGAVINQEYDVLLSDGTTWHCVTTGISE